MRVTLIGYTASGKTTLAKRIHTKFSIPHLQIDRVWFAANGHLAKTDSEKERAREIIKRELELFTQQDSWVSDGFYSKMQSILADRADYVVVLELPLWQRLYHHWSRVYRSIDRHPEVSRWKDLLFSFTIIKRSFTYVPRLRLYKEMYRDKLVILKNYKEIDTFFNSLK